MKKQTRLWQRYAESGLFYVIWEEDYDSLII